MTLVAGVDSSTQSCKVVIRDLESGAVVRTGRAPHPDGTEIDPQAWWDALLAAIADAGGRVIRPALLWNDTRSAQAATDLIAEVGAAEFARRTGSVPVASFTLTKLRWLADAEPENAARIAAVALPHDWLTWRLRGFGPDNPVLTELTTDRSDASGTCYFDPTTNEYDYDLLGRALRRALGNSGDSSRIILPKVLNPGDAAGHVDGFPEFPNAREIVVGVGAGDNAGAALGLGATTGDVVVSIGTSGTVFA